MATWVDPVDSETDPDAPLTSNLGKRWDNNVVAFIEGDATAPTLSLESFDRPVAGSGKVNYLDAAEVSAGATYITMFSYTTLSSGSIRIRMEWYTQAFASDTTIIDVLVNNVVVHTQNTSSGSATYQQFSYDLSISSGDRISFRFRNNGAGSSFSRNVEIRTSGGYIVPVMFTDGDPYGWSF